MRGNQKMRIALITITCVCLANLKAHYSSGRELLLITIHTMNNQQLPNFLVMGVPIFKNALLSSSLGSLASVQQNVHATCCEHNFRSRSIIWIIMHTTEIWRRSPGFLYTVIIGCGYVFSHHRVSFRLWCSSRRRYIIYWHFKKDARWCVCVSLFGRWPARIKRLFVTGPVIKFGWDAKHGHWNKALMLAI